MPARSSNQTFALLVGILFLVLGIAGFVPGIVTNYDELAFAGDGSRAETFGVLQTSILHNLVHVLFGIAGIAMARTWDGARTYLIGGGVIYLVLWIYGLIVDRDSGANFIPLNTGDNWLHFFLGIGMIGLGFVTTRDRATRPAATT